MKDHIVVSDYKPELSREWDATHYPGPGIYETSVGFAVVYGTVQCLSMITVRPMPEIVRQPPQAANNAGAVDVHRLFDQLIELKG